MRNSTTKYGKWALVTGGSAGIGKAMAQKLAAKGHNLILVARNEEKLIRVANEIEQQHKIQIETYALDLTIEENVQELFERTGEKFVGMLVANAGLETSGHFTKVSQHDHRQLIELNINVPAAMAQHYGAEMVGEGKGAIIFMSSLFGYQGVPIVANYSASKAYILALGEALHVELGPMGVDVLVVSPGLTETAMPAAMPIDFSKMPITKHRPEKVARAAMSALGRRATKVPGLLNWVYAFENRFIPRLWPTRLFGYLLKRAMPKEDRARLLNTQRKGAHK